MRGKIWNFNKPTDPAKVIRFENTTGETFSAMYKAKAWLNAHGYVYGSTDGSPYLPALKGDRYSLPQKLYNFELEDYKQVNAVLYSHDYRDGWVEVWLVEYMRVLFLSLKKRWYEMIASGKKKEEYREVNQYWCRRLLGFDHVLFSQRYGYNSCNQKDYTHVEFTLGYPAKSDTNRRMRFKIEDIVYGRGNPEWGAPDNKVFIIKLGEKV